MDGKTLMLRAREPSTPGSSSSKTVTNDKFSGNCGWPGAPMARNTSSYQGTRAGVVSLQLQIFLLTGRVKLLISLAN